MNNENILDMYNGIRVIKEITVNKSNSTKRVLCECRCGKIFEVMFRKIKSGETKSCGCAVRKNYKNNKYGLITVLESTNKISKSKTVIWKCVCDCGKELELSVAQFTKKTRWSCGCDKSNIIKTCKNRAGKNHHWYDNNLSDKERLTRGKRYTYEFTKGVFKKYNFTCIKCNKRGGRLCAHHLDSYHWYEKGRNDIENGACVCRECHKLFHKVYGKKWNTREQFNQFIGQKI